MQVYGLEEQEAESNNRKEWNIIPKGAVLSITVVLDGMK